MEITKKVPSKVLVKRFYKHFIQKFHRTLNNRYVESTYTEATFEEVITFVLTYNFSKELVDANSKKPLKLYLSHFKAGIYDVNNQRFIAVQECILTNISREQTQENWCHNPGIKRMTGKCSIIVPFKDRLKECWLSIYLYVL